MHRDIRPTNILLSSKGPDGTRRAVISDFDQSREVPTKNRKFQCSRNIGQRGWACKEIASNSKNVVSICCKIRTDNTLLSCITSMPKLNMKVLLCSFVILFFQTNASDVFALGCIFFYVLTDGCHPFDQREDLILNGTYCMDDLALSSGNT